MTPTTSVALRGRLGDAAVLTDFDGTLSPIVADPAAAAPGPGALAVLSDLVPAARVVGVISGRPVAFLAERLPDERLHLAGLYGFERRIGGVTSRVPDAERWAAPVAAAVADLTAAVPAGVIVEAKDLSLTVHHRTAPEAASTVEALAGEVAGRHGLTVRPARASFELHPPVAPDKGMVVEEMARGCTAVCFLGDDVGDLTAFAALDRLSAEGLATVKVAVATAESVPEVLAAADEVVDGTEGAIAWLESLLP